VVQQFKHLEFCVKGGPEPSKQIIQKVLFPIGRFHFWIKSYQNKSDRIILPGAFRDLHEVFPEVPEFGLTSSRFGLL